MIPFRPLLTLLAPTLLWASPEGGEPQRFTLVEEGHPKCVILLNEQPSESDRDAAEELNYWVEAIAGARLKVIAASEWDQKMPYIAIGESEVTRSNGWRVDQLGFEEAKVIIEPGRIGLLGSRTVPAGKVPWPESAVATPATRERQPAGTTGPGSYYAALEFVQHKLGARWIWPGKLGEVYSRSRTLQVEPGKWRWEPSGHLGRGMRGAYGSSAKRYEKTFGAMPDEKLLAVLDQELDQWRKRQRMNRPEKTRTGLTFASWWEKHFKDHPEWFAKPPKGRKPLTRDIVKLNLSNPEVVEQVVKEWDHDRKHNPDLNFYFNITPNDLKGFDTRKETRALDAPEMQALSDDEIWISDKAILSDRYLYFWNAIAEKIARINPDTRLMTFAYCRYRKPPLMGGKVHDSLVLGYVGGEGFYPDEPEMLEDYLGWQKLGGKLYWRSNLFHCGHGIPYLYSSQLHHELTQMIANHLLGTDYDSLTGNWANQGLNYYVAAEAQNRPKADYQTLASEYYQAFGPAADAMQAYHTYFEQLVKEKAPILRDKQMVENESWGKFWRGHMRFVAVVFTDDVLGKGESFLKKAEQAVANGAPEAQARVRFVRAGFDHAALMAKTFREIGLHRLGEPLNLDYQKLEPLWKLRQQQIARLEFNSINLLMHEQIQFNLWGDFIYNAKHVLEHVTRTPMKDGWEAASVAKGNHDWRGSKEGGDWKALQQVEQAVPSPEGYDAVYRTTFDMPQLHDHQQYAVLQFEGVVPQFRLWINGRRVPAGHYKALKGTPENVPTVIINILDFVEQAKPVTLEIQVPGEGGDIRFAKSVNLLTQ